jgi:TRAP-type C4-dicarboxylate transport system substrate-binding protein
MKKRIFGYAPIVSMVLVLTAAFIFGTFGTSPAADQPIILKYQGKWVGHKQMGWAAEQLKFADRVKAATSGKVLIQNVDDVKPENAVIDGVKSGVFEIGAQGVFARGELVLANWVSMPFVPFDKMMEMYAKMRPLFNDYWDKNFGLKYMGTSCFLDNLLFTKAPCTTIEDIRKMKIRVTNRLIAEVFKDAGGHPITMINAEVFTSLQRGVIEGAITSYPAYFDGGISEVCKYVSSWPVGTGALAVTINKESWNKLGPQLQGQVMAAWYETEKAQFAAAKADMDAMEAKAKSLGAKRMDPTKAEWDKLIAFAAPGIENWKKLAGPDSVAVMKVVNETLGTKY